MDYTAQALTYALLLLPALFSFAVIGQGVYKYKKNDKSGLVIIALGILFLLLIPVGYIFFIRI